MGHMRSMELLPYVVAFTSTPKYVKVAFLYPTPKYVKFEISYPMPMYMKLEISYPTPKYTRRGWRSLTRN